MQLVPIGKAAALFSVSTRTLRYYESIGLLQSERSDENSYRYYSSKQLERLQQILVLRKLRVPLGDIANIVNNPSNHAVFRTLRLSLAGIDDEIAALGQVRTALAELINHLQTQAGSAAYHLPRVAEAELLPLLQALPSASSNIKEALPMQEKKSPVYRSGDVRIVYLPPATVAATHHVGGGEPEEVTRQILAEFIAKSNLAQLKPGFRVYGFNHPNGELPDGSDHGYERWVTIPENMAVFAPLTKKLFAGGLYAARAIPFGQFEEWEALGEWVEQNPEYEANWGPPEQMAGLLEEELNYIHLFSLPPDEQAKKAQLDLLLPVKPYEV